MAKIRKGYKKAEKFERINRSNLKLKNHSKRTRTGAYKTPCRVKAH